MGGVVVGAGGCRVGALRGLNHHLCPTQGRRIHIRSGMRMSHCSSARKLYHTLKPPKLCENEIAADGLHRQTVAGHVAERNPERRRRRLSTKRWRPGIGSAATMDLSAARPVISAATMDPISYCASTMCTGLECCEARAGCCNVGPKCTASTMLRSSPPSYCASTTCTESECCEARDQSSNNGSECTALTVLRSSFPSYCALTTCTESEGCEAQDQ